MPDMPTGAVPGGRGITVRKSTRPKALKNPLPQTSEIIEQGQTSYEYFCVMCHGPNHDGQGTVGQSFSPLPAALKDLYVQSQTDGMLFKKISLGFQTPSANGLHGLRGGPLGSGAFHSDIENKTIGRRFGQIDADAG